MGDIVDDIELADMWMDSPERLSGLSEKQLVVLLLDFVGYNQTEVGIILGITQPAVSKRLQRTKRVLEAYRIHFNGEGSGPL